MGCAGVAFAVVLLVLRALGSCRKEDGEVKGLTAGVCGHLATVCACVACAVGSAWVHWVFAGARVCRRRSNAAVQTVAGLLGGVLQVQVRMWE